MDTTLGRFEEKNKKKGITISTLLHILFVLLIIFPFLKYPDPPPGQEGILVNLGLPDQGQGEDNAAPAETSEPEESEEPEPTPVEEPEEVEPTPPKVTQPVKEKEVIKTEDPEAIALKREKERKKKEEEDRLKKEREEQIKKQQAEAEKKRQEEERKRKEAEIANKIGGLFGDGDGKGQTGKPGNQGDPDGDPNSNVLIGKSTGSGVVGGGLGNRGVVGRPSITDNTQASGKVVLRVCVNPSGTVTRVEFTQSGSTTTNSELISIAERNARKWKFKADKNAPEEQCGTITYDFKLQ